MHGERTETALAGASSVGYEGKFDCFKTRYATVFVISGMTGFHEGEFIDCVKFVRGIRHRRRVLDDESIAMLLRDNFPLKRVLVFIEDSECLIKFL